jgi:hypothetical protein
MAENAFVCWTTATEPWLIEAEALKTVCLPLNIQHNRHHPFCAQLAACRREMKRRADGVVLLGVVALVVPASARD